MENFSKHIRIIINDVAVVYKSEEEAVSRLFQRFNGKYSRGFIRNAIRNGQWDTDNWGMMYANDDSALSQPEKKKHARGTDLYDIFRNKKHLSVQKDIYGKEFYYYDPLTQRSFTETLSKNQYNGICLMTAIYNAYPSIFSYSKAMLIHDLKILGQAYDDVQNVYTYINNKMRSKFNGNDLLKFHFGMAAMDVFPVINECIKNRTPVVIDCRGFNDEIGHTVNILAAKNGYYCIFDNAGNTFVKELSSSALGRMFKDTKEHGFDSIRQLLDKIGIPPKVSSKLNTYSLSEQDLEKLGLWRRDKADSRFIWVKKSFMSYAFLVMDVIYMNEDCKLLMNNYAMRYRVLTEMLEEINFGMPESHVWREFRERPS